uniref:TSA: Wollemia nobilis Ref_Wollemi_Transcript_14781_959 transcribed RNA sequence n=1 Tax=Wollemia nobilis TaxID=56998 RepID=A0A0C9S3R5_9CONI
MGNAIASSKGSGRVRIMKLDGEIMKLKGPVRVEQVVRNYPNHVILHSDAVRHLGIRAKPLEGSTQLNPKHLYFLLEMPKIEDHRAPGRVRSEINMSAKSRLEAMLLERRSSSDISAISSFRPASPSPVDGEDKTVRVKVRLTKAQLAQLATESRNSSETAEKILELFLNKDAQVQESVASAQKLTEKPQLENSAGTCSKPRRNRVRFSPDVQSADVF